MQLIRRPALTPAPLLALPVNRFSPGYDASHIAAQKCVCSGISTGSGFFDLINGGKVGANSGATVASSMDGALGPSVNYTGTTALTTITPTFGTHATGNPYTWAAVFRRTASPSASGGVLTISSSAAGNGPSLLMSAAALLQVTVNGATAISTGVTATLNVPFFFVASCASIPANTGSFTAIWAITNLATGQLFSGSGSSGTTNNGGGALTAISVGSRPTADRVSGSSIAAVMHGNTFLSQYQLLKWAADPWSFWYPARGPGGGDLYLPLSRHRVTSPPEIGFGDVMFKPQRPGWRSWVRH